mmetsp:Transcript_48475/g.48829  ORF Transcript_48475/g.48829 Transcript_48475/m.48829 type:complete len:134 (-) Transcript_48475:440-841(-)
MYVDMCVHNPLRFIEYISNAGATWFVFQWKSISNQHNSTVHTPMSTSTPTDNPLHNLLELNSQLTHILREVLNVGMNCRILIYPSTPLETIYTLLQTGLVNMMDILAMEPGFGGQSFQICVLDKIRMLQAWID